MLYRHKRDNFLFQIFNKLETVGEYSMPKIKPITEATILNILPYNYVKSCKKPEDTFISFYVDDYQFERVWNEPIKSLKLLKQFKGIFAPDFSLYRDFPVILNIYNCWRNKVLTAFYQMNGLKVIPNVSWSDEDSYKWCFDGLPTNSIVAVSSNGCIRDKVAKDLFIKGYNEMKRRLSPIKVIFVGTVPKELESDKIIEHFPAYSTLFNLKDKSLYFGGDEHGR